MIEILFELAKKHDRPVQSYALVFETLDWYSRLKDFSELPRHLTGQELVRCMFWYSVETYGLLAPEVWRALKIEKSEDVGEIVWQLVEAQLIGKQDTDSKEDFNGILTIADFDKVHLRMVNDSNNVYDLSVEYIYEGVK